MSSKHAEQKQPLIITDNNMKTPKKSAKKTTTSPSNRGNTPKQDASKPTSNRKKHPSQKPGSCSAANPEIDDTAHHVEHYIIRNWEYGETRLIRIGIMWWMDESSLARIDRLLPGNGLVGGPVLVVPFASSDLPFAGVGEGTENYVRLDTAMRFMGKAKLKDGSKRPSKVYNRLAHQECNSILDYNLPELKASVSAKTAHKILDPHMEFGPWVDKIARMIRNSDFENRHLEMPTGYRKGDFRIPVTQIVEVASGYDSFAGLMTYVLLTDGGFFHGGDLGESADASLERFVDMVPDQSGTVDCTKLHEFLGDTRPYDEWLMELLGSDPDDIHCSILMTDEDAYIEEYIDESSAFLMIYEERLNFILPN